MKFTTPRSEQGGNNKRPPSHAASAERWDLHKKPRPEEKDNVPQTEDLTTEEFAMARPAHSTRPRSAFKGTLLGVSF
jgi:hypothetical protein